MSVVNNKEDLQIYFQSEIPYINEKIEKYDFYHTVGAKTHLLFQNPLTTAKMRLKHDRFL